MSCFYSISAIFKVKIWFQNKRSKEKKSNRQGHRHRSSNDNDLGGAGEEIYSDDETSSTSTNNNDSSLQATPSIVPACESKDIDGPPTTQSMIKSSPNIYEQSSPPAALSSSTMMSAATAAAAATYASNDFLRSSAMHFEYGAMNHFWPTHLYENNPNANAYYQQHPAPIHT